MPFVEFVLHWAGCPDSAAAVRLFYTTEEGTEGHRRLSRGQPLWARVHPHWPWGRAWRMATLTASPGRSFSTQRKLDLAATPRATAAGSALSLRFELAPQLDHPWVLAMGPEGTIDRIKAEGGSPRWRAPLRFDEPGDYWIEILAEGFSRARGRRALSHLRRGQPAGSVEGAAASR